MPFNLKILIFVIFLMSVNNAQSQLSLLNDEFNGSSLDANWIEFQSQYYNISLAGGQLMMDIEGSVCNNNCPWYHAQTAGFIYKYVAGDFEVTTAAYALEASGSNQGMGISNDTQLGGIMARENDNTSENYVFNVVGKRFDVSSIETKSTTNNHSGTIQHFMRANTNAELKMTREGAIFKMFSRSIGATNWTLRSTFNRPDLPDSLQVGIIGYAFESYPEDLMINFDYVHFSEIYYTNEWLGGNGNWNDSSKWSLNHVPDSSEAVLIDNIIPQIIQILPNENYSCLKVEIINTGTELNVLGNLTVLQVK